MAVKRPPAIAHLPNPEFLNKIRKDLVSPAFQARVPNFTKANLQNQWQRLSELPELRNEFISALINRIGRQELNSLSFDNPLQEFKRQSLLYGNIIEEVQTGLIKAKTYDPTRSGTEEDLFAREYPEVQSRFHTVSRRDFYKNTIDEPALRAAFLSDEGLAPFVTQLMSMANESDKYDEFIIMAQLLVDMYKADGYFKVNIPDLTAANAGSDEAKAALKAFRTAAGKLKYPTRRYNSAQMMVSAKAEELILFVTPEVNATLDVDGLAALFNIERGQVPYRIIEIPSEYWPIPGAQAVLTTRNFFVVADTFYSMSTQPNAVGRYENYFLHHDQIASMSSFAPAILFTTEPGTPEVIEVSPVTAVTDLKVLDVDGVAVDEVERGGVYMVEGNVVTAPLGGTNDALRYELVGKTSTRTRVWQTNTMIIGRDEKASEIVVVGYAVDSDNPQIKAETIVTVSGPAVIEFPPQTIAEGDIPGETAPTP